MPLPAEAKELIAQTIALSAAEFHLEIPKGGLAQMMDHIERDLDVAGFVVMSRETLAGEIEEGSYEANYEDGQ